MAEADRTFEVLVLDIGIPGPDGLAGLRRLRDTGDDRPVLLLTGRGAVSDRVAGVRAGADDYLPKPFVLDESNVVAVYVKYLRDKVDRPFGVRSVSTVRGLGYRWDPDS